MKQCVCVCVPSSRRNDDRPGRLEEKRKKKSEGESVQNGNGKMGYRRGEKEKEAATKK